MLFGFDRNDPEDAVRFTRWLFNICLWAFVILAGIIMTLAIFDGGLPPEPQWWLEFEKAIGVTW